MTDSSDQGPPYPPNLTDEGDLVVTDLDAVEYDTSTDTYRMAFDGESRPVNEVVFSTVAAVSGTEPLELPPLYHAVDPDALDALVGGDWGTSSENDVSVSFRYHDHAVTVRSDGLIAVRPPDINADIDDQW